MQASKTKDLRVQKVTKTGHFPTKPGNSRPEILANQAGMPCTPSTVHCSLSTVHCTSLSDPPFRPHHERQRKRIPVPVGVWRIASRKVRLQRAPVLAIVSRNVRPIRPNRNPRLRRRIISNRRPVPIRQRLSSHPSPASIGERCCRSSSPFIRFRVIASNSNEVPICAKTAI